MASIYQRKNKNGTKVWRAVIRITGYPSVSDCFERKQEAEDWARETQRQITAGKYDFQRSEQKKTLSDLLQRYVEDGALAHHKSAADTRRHLEHFQNRIGPYALVYITPEMLLKERKYLVDSPTDRGGKRNTATVNRYMSSLGGMLRYGCRTLRWLEENPCANIQKLKEAPKERRVLTEDEVTRLLKACRNSRSPYLFCITLMALTTGARKGEILALTWDCIDFENRLAHIKDSKNGRPRRIALVDCVIQELRRLVEVRNPRQGLVFPSKTAFGQLDVKKSWQSAVRQAGIEDFVFHGLRHHFSSFGGQIGASGVQLRAQLGHASSSMTDHYSHLEANATRFIGEAIEQQIKKSGADV